jgi:hypothetical protein
VAELGRVVLADHDRARGAQARDLDRVLDGEIVAKCLGAEGGRHPGHFLEVFDADRHAGERPNFLAPRDPLVHRTRLRHRPLRTHRAEGVEFAVERLDAREGVRDSLAWFEFAFADERGQFARRLEVEFCHRGLTSA